MSQVLTGTETRVREAWGMVERADPGDSLSVGVALDYVMDNLGVERDRAKVEFYRHCARLVTESARTHEEQGAATSISLYLYDGHPRSIGGAELFLRGWRINNRTEWAAKVSRWVKLCSWIGGVE